MRKLLLVLLWIVSLTAVFSGSIMILYPGGSILNLSVSVLQGTPFTDFQVPGMILLGVGIVHLFAIFHWWQNTEARFNWAIAAGLLIIGWIMVQMLLLSVMNWWQVGYLVAGVLILLMAWQMKGRWLA